ncbi:NAD(P)H-binding protein [Candidatus Saccharibacteria bacterium]|nr:NAD(P)H-binding protein [Candidatus Saccharibacteria bacterium]
MRILLIGANGRTGMRLKAINKDHQLVDFIGDFRDGDTVEKFLPNIDAVLCVVGHVKGSSKNVQSEGINTLISKMQKFGIGRIVMLTGTGVRLPGDKITLIDRVLNFGVKLVDPNRVSDGIESTKILTNSKLEYTVLRVLKLTNGKPKLNWKLSENGPTISFVSRDSVALALFECLDKRYSRQCPMMTRK